MEYDQKMKDKFKQRLKKIIAKKIDTTMIFPLSQFEVEFGHLWGQGKDEAELTDQEKEFRDKWKKCRNNILNNGNQQKRNAGAEIDMYQVIWNLYQTVFYTKDSIYARDRE